MALSFEIASQPDEDGLWLLIEYEDGIEVYRTGYQSKSECFNHVEAARESEVYTLEERLEPFGLEWQREQEVRW